MYNMAGLVVNSSQDDLLLDEARSEDPDQHQLSPNILSQKTTINEKHNHVMNLLMGDGRKISTKR